MPSRVGRNAAALLAARVTSAGATLVATPFLFGLLGPDRFGVWVLLLGLVAVAGLADLGFGSAQVREVAQALATDDVRRARGALAVGLTFFSGVGIAFLVAVWLARGLLAASFDLGPLADEAGSLAVLLALAFAVDLLSKPWQAALEGSQRMVPVAGATAAAAVLASALGVVLVAVGSGLAGLGWAAVIASAARTALMVASAARWAGELSPDFRSIRRDEIRPLLGYGARVQASNAAAAVNVESDRIALGAFVSSAAVASFDIGAKLVGALRIVPWHVLAALFPVAAAADARGGGEQLDRLYLRTTRYLAFFAALSGGALIVSAEPLVTLWIGEPLPLAATTVMILAPAYAVNLTSGAAAAVARAEGFPGRETRYAVLAAVLNVALTVPLLILVGPVGVPTATALSYVGATTYFFCHFHRESGRPVAALLGYVWKPFAASAVAVLVTVAAQGVLPGGGGDRLGAAAAAGSRTALLATVACSLLAVLRFFDAGDRMLAARLVRPRVTPSSKGAPA